MCACPHHDIPHAYTQALVADSPRFNKGSKSLVLQYAALCPESVMNDSVLQAAGLGKHGLLSHTLAC